MQERTTRPGGRTARVRADVLAAALELADRADADFTVSALASTSGVNEATIYRRWGGADGVLLDAFLDEAHSNNPMVGSGDLGADLTRWAEQAERDLGEPRGQRLLVALARASDDGARTRALLEHRYQALRDLLASAQPPTQVTTEDVLDGVLAPLYLRRLMGYSTDRTAAELVADVLRRR